MAPVCVVLDDARHSDADRTSPMRSEQIRLLNDRPVREDGDFVLYWMQRSQRAEGNLALTYAVRKANALELPVLVVFSLFERYPEANERHFAFMLEGLADAAEGLAARGIGFRLIHGAPPDAIFEEVDGAALVVCDRGYLSHLRSWRDQLARYAKCRVLQVEDNAVVPVDLVSNKREYAARTIRPKIHRHLRDFLVPVEDPDVVHRWASGQEADGPTVDAEAILRSLAVDRDVGRVAGFRGGRQEALRRLEVFVTTALIGYAEKRSDPALTATSLLSPYLHFGHIAPTEIVIAVLSATGCSAEDRETLVEELVIRRELSLNYTTFEPHYDTYDALPGWARDTLRAHAGDRREFVYSVEQLEAAETHDPYWNAAMAEMVKTGYMHNYMRMYWGKKILEWTADPEDAFYTTLYLNNKYFLDGRDPNSYAGVGWIFGLHDRPWTQRPIFGTVRYMNANGLKRKFDIEAYVRRVNEMT